MSDLLPRGLGFEHHQQQETLSSLLSTGSTQENGLKGLQNVVWDVRTSPGKWPEMTEKCCLGRTYKQTNNIRKNVLNVWALALLYFIMRVAISLASCADAQTHLSPRWPSKIYELA